jgi:hypothetical protein
MESGGSITVPPALKKQLEAAETAFAAGDLKSAKRHADMAKALFGHVPEAQRAHAAYRVHAAGKGDHYAVLGVAAPPNGRPTKDSHDAVKASHKALCDAFDPANAGAASSAAVAAALKLVNQAFAALTDIRKNEAAAAVTTTAAPLHRLPPLRPVLRPKTAAAARPVRVVVVDRQEMLEPAAVLEEAPVPEHKEQGMEEEDEDYYADGRNGRR